METIFGWTITLIGQKSTPSFENVLISCPIAVSL